MKRWVVVPVAAAVVLLGALPASAHVELESSTPAEGARLAKAPTAIGLRFSDEVSAGTTRIALTTAGRPIAVGKPAGTGSRVAVTVPGPLANGAYTVAYRTVSRDGHTVEGSYGFTLAAPAAATPSPTAAPTTAAPTTSTPAPTTLAPATSAAAVQPVSTQDGGPGAGILAAAIGLPVLAVLAIGFVVLGRRRTA